MGKHAFFLTEALTYVYLRRPIRKEKQIEVELDDLDDLESKSVKLVDFDELKDGPMVEGIQRNTFFTSVGHSSQAFDSQSVLD